jgi:SAM-dependent methyltransferase
MMARQYAQRFGDDLVENLFDRSAIDAALDRLPQSALIVDLGCGPGQAAAYARERGFWSAGVELTPAMLDAASRENPRIPLINGNLLDVPLRAGTLDGAIACFSMHNLPRALLASGLALDDRDVKPPTKEHLRREDCAVTATGGQ